MTALFEARRPLRSAPSGLQLGPLGPRFDTEVPPGGYAWWYLDVIADDGETALTLIAFVGAAFSPGYYRDRNRALRPDPMDHCALNVALYGPRTDSWALTEHPRHEVVREPDALCLGRSRLHWDGRSLQVLVDERTPWLGRRIRGSVRLWPQVLHRDPVALDPDARHQWWCLAPLSRVEVDLEHPQLRFDGVGYLDANYGREPLDLGMSSWDWCRARTDDEAVVVYDTRPRRGEPVDRAFRFTRRGQRLPVELPHRADLPRGVWGVSRGIRCEHGGAPRLVQTLEDGPFYTRSLVRARFSGADHIAVSESISLDRFRHPVVRTMLPFRMRPRWLR